MSTLYSLKDLEKIDLKCPNEKEYNDPIKMFDENNNKLYAYATLIMMNDLYISAAIVLANTLRKLDTKADLVVLVTHDISDDGKNALRKYYDHVIEVSYIKVYNWRTNIQKHRMYLNYVFTKFHVFNLVQYKKILLIDADALILKKPDHLFSLNTPAGVYLENKNLFMTYDNDGNYILPNNKKIEWYNRFCDCCEHGKVIPKEYTDRVVTIKRNSGIAGGLMLLEPNKNEFVNILRDIKHGKSQQLINKWFVWPEQQYLTYRYSGKWHSINPTFLGLQGYPHWKVLYGLQYAGDKPFTTNSKFDIEQRIAYPDFKLWHAFYAEVLNEHPEFKENIALKEANEMNKYFSYDKSDSFNEYKLSRTKKQSHIKYNTNDISDKLSIDKNTITNNQLNYFHLDSQKPFSAWRYDNTMFNVKLNDYKDMLEQLKHEYKNTKSDYYEKLLNRIHKYNERIDKLELDVNDQDSIALEYTKCRKDIFCLTLWPLAVPHIDKLLDILEKDGNVCYVKKLSLDFITIRNIAYKMYDDFTLNARLEFVDKKLDYANVDRSDNNDIIIILFDNIKGKRISGQGAKYKRYLRYFLLDQLSNKKDYRGNDLLHINDHYYQAVEYSQIFFNNNTINLYKQQKLHRLISDRYKTFMLRFETMRKWSYMNLNQKEISRICFMGGALWYSYGIRPSNDLDCIIINTNKKDKREDEFERLIDNNFVNEKTKFIFADMGIENSKHWNPKWNIKNDKLLESININSFDDIVCNPKYHYYFNGFKFYLVSYEIARKFLRFRSQDIADFTMLYFNFKDVIDDNIQFNEDNKIIKPKYTNSKPHNNHTLNRAMDLIKQRYEYNDYKCININMLKKIFRN